MVGAKAISPGFQPVALKMTGWTDVGAIFLVRQIPLFDTGCHARYEPDGVFTIDFLQYILRQFSPINCPQALWWRDFFAVGEMLVARLKESPVILQTLLRPRSIGSKQDAIGILDKKIA